MDEESELVCLAVQHAGGHWGVPKGHPETGESIEQTIERELAEETGLALKRLLREPVFTNTYSFKKDGVLVNKETKYYLALMEKQEPVISEEFRPEILQAVWMPFSELIGLVGHADAKAFMMKISEYLNEHQAELVGTTSP